MDKQRIRHALQRIEYYQSEMEDERRGGPVDNGARVGSLEKQWKDEVNYLLVEMARELGALNDN